MRVRVRMVLYLIDTPTVIDFSKGMQGTRARMRAAAIRRDRLATCDVVVAECFSGVYEAEWARWEAFFSALTYLDSGRAASLLAGRFRRDARRSGHAVSAADALIAAVAAVHDAIVVTENVKDFRLFDVTLESWRR